MNVAIDRCPRCAHSFRCGFADAAPCACTTITLDAELLTEMRRRYRGCLCLRCLTELSANGSEGLPQSRSSLHATRIEAPAAADPPPEE